eukprot:Selendium_serpulae@DN4911_c0_g1_i2.p1
MPPEIRARWEAWAQDAAHFSNTTMVHRRVTPHSTAYASGNPAEERSSLTGSTMVPSNLLRLNWHRAVNNTGIESSAAEAPNDLADQYAACVARLIAQRAENNSDFRSDPERFPNIRRLLDVIKKDQSS